jgi:uncharacterized SAM-binding protein YcdF (DUF218 family)
MPPQADVLIVLGAALTADGRLGPALAERVEAGVSAWKSGLAPRLLMTGAYEASAMKARAVELGVPTEAILVEHTALTTRENALFSGEILRQNGLRRALLVTQPYHRRRAVAAFRRVGISAEALRFRSKRDTIKQHGREVVARLVYRLRGWI